MNEDRVTIVGAGMAGLVLARILQRGGVPVVVLDQEAGPEVRAQGGLLDIHEDSGQYALHAAGLAAAFDELVEPGGEARRVLDSHGTVRWSSTGPGARPEIDRGALRDLLLESVAPGTVQWNAKVTAVRPHGDGTHELRLVDGSTIDAGLVVGADGAWSHVREAVTDLPTEYSGVTSIEACLHDADRRHPQAAALVGEGNYFAPGRGRAILGHHERSGTIRTRAMIDVPQDWATRVDVTRPEGVADVLEYFADWAPAMRSLIADSDTPLIVRPLHAIPVGAHWPPRSGITLVGDAAHLTTPFAGLGANVAMLDGARLAEELLKPDRTTDDAVAAYEADMFPRAEAAAAESARNLEIIMHDPAPPQRFFAVMEAEEPEVEPS